MRIAINGFGRIGRMVFRKAILESLDVVAINASYPSSVLAHLLTYDTVHGKYSKVVEDFKDYLKIDDKKIKLCSDRDPLNLPWKQLGIDVVIEATGKFCTKDSASLHLEAGAKKVIITAPCKDADVTIVMGVNEGKYNKDKHNIISSSSCTTNCLAPVAKVLDESFGIEKGLMTTVHAFTNDQKNLDNPHKDLRRARSCFQAIIPTKTGAASSIGLVLENLKGKLNGLALRVPVCNVSVVDLNVTLKQDVTVEEVNNAFEKASLSSLKGILSLCKEPLVSADFIGSPFSAIVDVLSTMVVAKKQVKVLAWYDNEWGYSCRVVDLIKLLGESF